LGSFLNYQLKNRLINLPAGLFKTGPPPLHSQRGSIRMGQSSLFLSRKTK